MDIETTSYAYWEAILKKKIRFQKGFSVLARNVEEELVLTSIFTTMRFIVLNKALATALKLTILYV